MTNNLTLPAGHQLEVQGSGNGIWCAFVRKPDHDIGTLAGVGISREREDAIAEAIQRANGEWQS